MKVLIAGANGYTGRNIVEFMSQRTGHEAYAMIRHSDQAEKMMELGAAGIIVADLEQDLSEAVQGMDAIIFAAGSGSKTGPEKTISVDQEGAKRLVDAAKENGIKHFVMLSSIGADRPHGKIKHYLEAKGIADEHLKKSGLTYTIVRPGRLTHEPGKGRIELVDHFEKPQGRDIPRADVAHVLVASLDIDNVKNKTFEILSGDEKIEEAMKSY
ncbi:SDR family oxidoreductase [Paenactinomyces guangxiensis]|uniref:SDR family oxidoreductase n=1 Tax=Paenactinomyces guangxiensis TaxID=1490290 RepID=A0A7W1WTP6_9BACL|nr:SDR family oxidoreductase [Paenactinomyces guangxiensis]MBA4495656.1 SDR family oxidoreductase [Paenactinomyces guangxiensis]MBH8592644.1 SDR family oxidoreductase [Paenactinomyces guangxiensis]